MTKDSSKHNFQEILLSQIDRENRLTDFSLGADPELLDSSIREIGVTHPVTLLETENKYAVVCGHRRVRLAEKSDQEKLSANVLSHAMDVEMMLAVNLTENQCHRQYSDIEKGGILFKLENAGVPEERIIQKYMPIIGLERSKKLFLNYRNSGCFGDALKILLHESGIPLRVFSVLFGWDAESRWEAEKLFAVLRPGGNKWRDLLELIDEIARRDGVTPADILPEVESEIDQQNLSRHEKYDKAYRVLHDKRYPVLSGLQKKLAQALDSLKLDHRTKVRTPKNFESGDICIELKFTNEKELVEQIEKLSTASRSESISNLIRLFKDPGNNQ